MAETGSNESKKASEEDEKGFDVFELISAIVLGLGALGGAWAGFQSGLWGGNQATAYAEASNMTSEASAIVTEAASSTQDATLTGNRDADIDLQVKRLLFEVEEADDPAVEKRLMNTAKYLYMEELSDSAKKYLGLPKKPSSSDLSDKELLDANDKSLDDKYFEALYTEANAEYDRAEEKMKEAKKKFYEGQVANYNGDLLELTAVLYTIVLFLAGIGLVFKTKVRWAFAALSIFGLVGSTVHLALNPWTQIEAPKLEEPAAPASSAAPQSSAAP